MDTTITINGFVWNVFFVDKTHEQLTDENGKQDAYGITLFRECEIYIDSELPKALLCHVITHELVHALRFSYGVDLECATEEEFCDFVGAHFDEIKTLRKAVLKAL